MGTLVSDLEFRASVWNFEFDSLEFPLRISILEFRAFFLWDLIFGFFYYFSNFRICYWTD
jgi:hypothetical protein